MLPKGIVFINNDLTPSVQNALVTQLYITNIYNGQEFDQIMIDNPSYPQFVQNNNLRVMVIRSFLEDGYRDSADVVIFVTHGTASILKNKFGPPGNTFRVAELTWQKLCVFDMSIFSCKNCGCSKEKCCCKKRYPVYEKQCNQDSCSPNSANFTSSRWVKSKRKGRCC
jgi:hypothetical protein